jgi:signal transduction histidine kinase
MREASRLLSHLSHELRAPLGVVRGYLRLLEQSAGAFDERQRKAVIAALDASSRAVAIVEETSELSRLLGGETAFRRVTIPLSSLLHASVQAVELPEDPAVDLDVVEASNVIVSVDEARLRAALVAFLTAIVRAQSRPVTVQIRATRLPKSRRPAVRVLVAPRTVSGLRGRERPFDPARGGQGLQLAIAVAVVEAHGGNVQERSLGNRPAGLVVRLPVAR